MKKWTGMITNLTMLTQFGLSLVTPLFLCLALCWWLCDRFSVGTWIYLIGFFFGIGGGAVTAWKFGQSVLRHQKRSETEPDGKRRKRGCLSTDIFRTCLKKFSQLTKIKRQRKDFRLILRGKSLRKETRRYEQFRRQGPTGRKAGDKKCCHLYRRRRSCDVGRISDPAPDLAGKIPFDYRVILGGIGGGAVAVLNFS